MSTIEASIDEQQHEQDAPPASSGVRWKRFAGMLGITGAVAAGLIFMTAQGVLASAFSISGMPFVITADKLHGDGFEQYAEMDNMIKDSPNEAETGGQVVVIVSAIDTAELTNLCQSVNIGGQFLKITAGDAGKGVTAKTLLVDSDLISGDATFNKIDIGQDASTLTRTPGITGGAGVFGQQAKTVEILHLRQNNWATTAAVFKLPHLRMTFTDDGC